MSKPNPPIPLLLTVSEAAAHLGVTVRTIHRWIAAGQLEPARKLPGARGAYLIHEHDLRRIAGERGRA